MTLLEKTYWLLRDAGLTVSAEAFSTDYLGKNRNWFSYQKYAGRDFSIQAAVQCLRSIRARQQTLELSIAKKSVFVAVELDLLTHLKTRHCVADVC